MIPLHKTCPRFKCAAEYSHNQLRQSPARDPAPRGIFQSEIQFLWHHPPGYGISDSMASSNQDLEVLLHARQHNPTQLVKHKRENYSDRVTSPKKSVKTMKAELVSCIIAEAPLALLPRALPETLTLFPQKPEPVSSSEGTRTVGWPPREYSTVIVRFEPTTSCLHERRLCQRVRVRR